MSCKISDELGRHNEIEANVFPDGGECVLEVESSKMKRKQAECIYQFAMTDLRREQCQNEFAVGLYEVCHIAPSQL